MTDLEENKLSGYESVAVVFDNNTEIYSHTEAFVPYVEQLNGNIDKIHEVAGIQGQIRTGTTAEKAALRTSLTDATIKVKNGVKALGVFTDNNKLKDSVSFTDSELKTSRDNVIADKAGIIYKVASGVIPQLEPYFVTEADVLAIHTLQKQYLDAIATPRYETLLSKDATRKLKALFGETDTLLREKIDETILIFQPANPDFVNNYFDARIIVDLGRRKSGTTTAIVKGTVKHFETGAPVVGATVRVVETGQAATTDADGKFTFIILNTGDYKFQVEKEGFSTYTEDTVRVEVGYEINFDFELEPIEQV